MYTQLNKLGVCVSHKTSNIIIRKLGEKYDQKVRDWTASCKVTICSQKGVVPLQDGDQEQLQDRGRQASGGQGQQQADGGQGQQQADGSQGQQQASGDQGQANGGQGQQQAQW